MSSLKAGAFAAIEMAVNQCLDCDPMTQEKIVGLDGAVVSIQCTEPVQSIYIVFAGKAVQLWTTFDGEANLTITASAGELFELMRLKNKPNAIIDSGVGVTGDTECLQALQSIIQGLDIDWEAVLADFSGGLVAHEVGKTARAFKHWSKGSEKEMTRLMSEYMEQELMLVATSDEVETFCAAVDDLRLSVDRLEAKLHSLQKLSCQQGGDN